MSTALRRVLCRFALRFGVLLLLPVLAGCGVAQGKVSGRVLLNGTPLPGGRVTFRPEDPSQNTISADIDEQGNYQVMLPVGEVQISVDNRELEPVNNEGGGVPLALTPLLSPEAKKHLGGKQPDRSPSTSPANLPEKPRGRYVEIPSKYYDIETSGLKFTVQRGEQARDIMMNN